MNHDAPFPRVVDTATKTTPLSIAFSHRPSQRDLVIASLLRCPDAPNQDRRT